MPVPDFCGGPIVHPGEAAAVVLHTWREWAPALPESTTTSVALVRLPDAPTVPAHLRGVLTVHVRVAHLGPAHELDALLQPLRRSAPALVDDVRARPFTEADEIYRDPAGPVPGWTSGAALVALPAAAVDAVLELAGPGASSPLTAVELRLMGGALARAPGSRTPSPRATPPSPSPSSARRRLGSSRPCRPRVRRSSPPPRRGSTPRG